ncbi:MAG: hypothetical protein JWQ38_2066, partial [Flavipsychrobacter sp.]|nr:hypothetical protein [Flavipsychrobacter sp.]
MSAPLFMFKKIIPAYIIVALLAIGCKDQNKTSSTTSSTSSTINNKIAPRDRSINSSNAYNDIFLDSTSVEKFIVAESLNDT